MDENGIMDRGDVVSPVFDSSTPEPAHGLGYTKYLKALP